MHSLTFRALPYTPYERDENVLTKPPPPRSPDLRKMMLVVLVWQSTALAFQPAHAVRSATAVRSAVSMQMEWEARKEAQEKAEAERMAKLMAHLRAPIRQYEGGWADTALRNGKKDPKRFGTGPDANLGKKEFYEDELLEDTHHGAIRDSGRRKGKYSATSRTLAPEKQSQLVLPEESFKVTKMEMSRTDEDFVLECGTGEEVEKVIDIKPMFLTKTEYFYGFTADSNPKISINREVSSHIEGDMPTKGHKGNDEDEDIKIKVKFTPDSAVGEFDAYLCFIFPTEKAFSKFYKITGKSTPGGAATRDAAPFV